MGYDYKEERPKLFTPYGMETYVQIRDRVKYLFAQAGAANVESIIQKVTGDSWTMLAAIDYLEEQGEVVKMVFPEGDGYRWTQGNVYTSPGGGRP